MWWEPTEIENLWIEISNTTMPEVKPTTAADLGLGDALFPVVPDFEPTTAADSEYDDAMFPDIHDLRTVVPDSHHGTKHNPPTTAADSGLGDDIPVLSTTPIMLGTPGQDQHELYHHLDVDFNQLGPPTHPDSNLQPEQVSPQTFGVEHTSPRDLSGNLASELFDNSEQGKAKDAWAEAIVHAKL